VFTVVPGKPPDFENAAMDFLSNLTGTSDVVVHKLDVLLVNHAGGGFPFKPLLKVFLFAPRPFQGVQFGGRVQLHHSIIILIDGLLFACFRVRLERDLCAVS